MMKFSLGAKQPETKPPPKSRKRPLDEDEPEETEQHVAISAVAGDGEVIEKEPRKDEKALVIQPLKNRDWREESRRKRQKAALPQNGVVTEEQEKAMAPKELSFGLTVLGGKKGSGEEGRGSAQPETQVDAGAQAESGANDGDARPNGLETQPVKVSSNGEISDEAAIKELLEGKSADTGQIIAPVQSEEDAYQQSVQNAPDAPTLEQYDAVPVDSFGLAYLRGYGYKEGQELGKDGSSKKKPTKAVTTERRPALLGIGAKESAAVGIELGAWGKGAGGGKGKRKQDESYNPVVLVNKRTGEKLSEDEYKKRLEMEKMVPERDEGREDGRKDRERSSREDYSREEKRSNRRDKYDDDDDDDRRSHRKSRYDDESDRDRAHRKEKDRDRESRYKDDRARDRDRDRDRDRRRDDKYHRSDRDKSDKYDKYADSSDDRKRKRGTESNDRRDGERSSKKHCKDDRYYERESSSRRDDRDRDRARDRESGRKYYSSSSRR